MAIDDQRRIYVNDRGNRRIQQELQQHGVTLDAIEYCPHHPAGSVDAYAIACECRKPAPGMLLRAAAAAYGWRLAFGDIALIWRGVLVRREVNRFLKIKRQTLGAPLLLVERRSFTYGDRPVELRRGLHGGVQAGVEVLAEVGAHQAAQRQRQAAAGVDVQRAVHLVEGAALAAAVGRGPALHHLQHVPLGQPGARRRELAVAVDQVLQDGPRAAELVAADAEDPVSGPGAGEHPGGQDHQRDPAQVAVIGRLVAWH